VHERIESPEEASTRIAARLVVGRRAPGGATGAATTDAGPRPSTAAASRGGRSSEPTEEIAGVKRT
jgi:hypothetical protein